MKKNYGDTSTGAPRTGYVRPYLMVFVGVGLTSLGGLLIGYLLQISRYRLHMWHRRGGGFAACARQKSSRSAEGHARSIFFGHESAVFS